jgi:uncharacterized membrane protein YoaT (DUF817 family)
LHPVVEEFKQIANDIVKVIVMFIRKEIYFQLKAGERTMGQVFSFVLFCLFALLGFELSSYILSHSNRSHKLFALGWLLTIKILLISAS